MVNGKRIWAGILLPVLALLVWLASGALAEEESYQPLTAAPSTYRGGLLTGDTFSGAAPLDVGGTNASIKEIGGNPMVSVSARFTISEAQVAIKCYLWHKKGSTYSQIGIAAVQTATATWDDTDTNGYYVAPQLYFDAGSGATHYELRVRAPTSGSVQLVPVVCGSDPSSP